MSNKALQTDMSLHRWPVGEPEEGLVLSGTLTDGGTLWEQSVSLNGSSASGTWKEGR